MAFIPFQKIARLTLLQGGGRAEDLAYSCAYHHLSAFRLGEFARWCRIAREVQRLAGTVDTPPPSS